MNYSYWISLFGHAHCCVGLSVNGHSHTDVCGVKMYARIKYVVVTWYQKW